MSEVIDSHQHFWRYDPSQYPWMNDDQSTLRRDHTPSDLEFELRAARVDATVAVQARQMPEETEFLLGLAHEHPFIRGVVGWFDLADPDLDADLERLSADPLLVGGRELIHDMPDLDYAVSAEHLRGVRALQRHGLAYDLLLRPEHLPAATRLVDLVPEQRFVVDHIAKPDMRSGSMEQWRTGLRSLAERPNVYCKLSGMVTQAAGAGQAVSREQLVESVRPYVDVCLGAFGPSRLMFGTDWPVCTVVAGYSETVEVTRDCLAGLSQDEKSRIMGGTCIEFYGLSSPHPARSNAAARGGS